MSIQHFQTKLGITKYSIVTSSNDSVTLRLMTEHDLAMLYEWLNRSHIVEWWGGEEARPTLADVQEQYLPSVLAQESVLHTFAMLNEADWVCPVVRCSWKRGRMVGRRNRSRSTRNRPVTGECITTGQKAWEPSWFELWLSCCSMIPKVKDPNGPVAEQLASDPMLRKRGLRQVP